MDRESLPESKFGMGIFSDQNISRSEFWGVIILNETQFCQVEILIKFNIPQHIKLLL